MYGVCDVRGERFRLAAVSPFIHVVSQCDSRKFCGKFKKIYFCENFGYDISYF